MGQKNVIMLKEEKWSGERLETFVYNENTIEHLHRYAIAQEYIKDKVVLDIACGEGYGTNLLSSYAKDIIGVDISSETVEAAKEKYKKNNLNFKVGSATQIPLEDKKVDVVVSFETIEHLRDHETMLQEFKRVLKEDGILIISSPDKKYYTDLRNYNNPFHVKELYFDEFKDLIKRHFLYQQFYFQNLAKGSIVLPEIYSEGVNYYHGDYNTLASKNFFGVYNISIASNVPLNWINVSFFDADLVDREKIKSENHRRYLEFEKEKAAIREQMRSTWRYRIGDLLLKPLKLLKR